MMRLFVCICYDYICGLAGICMCIMMTFVCAKDSSIKLVRIQNKYAEKNNVKISSSEGRKVSSSAVSGSSLLLVALARFAMTRCCYSGAAANFYTLTTANLSSFLFF